jgi:hypothetical protein
VDLGRWDSGSSRFLDGCGVMQALIPGVFGLSDNAARDRLGANTAIEDPRDMA